MVSVSIDATIRQWSLEPQELQRAKIEAQNPQQAKQEEPQQPMLSAEEEALLDELARDD